MFTSQPRLWSQFKVVVISYMHASMVQIVRRMIGLELFPRQKGSHWWECTVFSVHGNLKVEFNSWSEDTD